MKKPTTGEGIAALINKAHTQSTAGKPGAVETGKELAAELRKLGPWTEVIAEALDPK